MPSERINKTNRTADLRRIHETDSGQADPGLFRKYAGLQSPSDATPASLEPNFEDASHLPIPAIYVREATLGTARRVLQAANIDTGRPLVEYGLDSIRATELVVELENIFHVRIPDQQTVYLITVDDISDYLIAELVHAQRIL